MVEAHAGPCLGQQWIELQRLVQVELALRQRLLVRNVAVAPRTFFQQQRGDAALRVSRGVIRIEGNLASKYRS
jgi:hypothetical protein